MKIFKWVIITLLTLAVMLSIAAYGVLRASLPQLSGHVSSPILSAPASLARDTLGTAVITTSNQSDAAYVLGFAHAQDRYFQMDLLRRSAAGELSELVGKAALNVDKKARFHQFRQRAKAIYEQLAPQEKTLLTQYAKGANEGLQSLSVAPFEYLLTQTEPQAWLPYESILVTFSMYMDLQGGQVERDFALTALAKTFGDKMLSFFHLPSPYQAALDGSQQNAGNIEIPRLPPPTGISGEAAAMQNKTHWQGALAGNIIDIPEPADIGSNNWAVTGQLSDSDSAMLSDDMHLSLRVPPIWYRAQLNYQHAGNKVQVTGVTLPGTPLVIVGANGHIAWGFTNANFDNVDWIELSEDTALTSINETILAKGEAHSYSFEMSQYGPVKELMGKKYALAWVAHQPYAVNMQIAQMANQRSVSDGIELAKHVGIPLQNMLIVDKLGNAAWFPTGAVSARTTPSMQAISEQQYSPLWAQSEMQLPQVLNPETQRLWTANARVISTEDLARFGDGGYAVGARGLQIRDRLFEQQTFAESDFYRIQLDNEARFLMPWHALLVRVLSQQAEQYSQDLEQLSNWQACACADSVGYTLVRRFRSELINTLLSPISAELQSHGVSMRQVLRSIEPAIWLLLEQQPQDWLPSQYKDYNNMLMSSYDTSKARLLEKFDANPVTLAGLEWGKVNALKIQHPLSGALAPFKSWLDMPIVESFGDSFMPAVQGTSFGASQRLIVRPGDQEKAILSVPGGQSGHPLSVYYKRGFNEYAKAQNTPLLPQAIEHELWFND